MSSNTGQLEFGSGFWAALPYLAAVMTGLLGFFAARFTALAQLQKTLLDASRRWVVELQAQHALDGARVLELEAEILRQRGIIDSKIQMEQSLMRLLQRNGIEILGDSHD